MTRREFFFALCVSLAICAALALFLETYDAGGAVFLPTTEGK